MVMSMERIDTSEQMRSVGQAMPYVPPKGTRPANRKDLIRRAGAELFYEYGFASVSMNQIARAVSIGPSALYRHFSSKQELLVSVIEASVAEAHAALADARDDATAESLSDWNDAFVAMALDIRLAGVLWQREARQLPEQDQERLAAEVRQIRHELRQAIQTHHPEAATWSRLLTRAVLSICLSLSYHHVSLPRADFVALMKQMMFSVLNINWAVEESVNLVDRRVSEPRRSPTGTQEKLVAAASELFARRGFAQTGLDEIAAKVGIAEPSIYHHFPSKVALLFEVLQYGNDLLQKGRALALAVPSNPKKALGCLLDSYLDTVAADPALITLIVTELGNLDEEKRRLAVAQQRAYLNQWVDLMLQIDPTMLRDAARIRVHAVLMVINDCAARSHGDLDAAERSALELICQRLLEL